MALEMKDQKQQKQISIRYLTLSIKTCLTVFIDRKAIPTSINAKYIGIHFAIENSF